MKQHKFNSAAYEANIAALPELCFAKMPSDGSLVVIKRGERGYYPVDEDKYPLPAHETRDDQITRMNEKMGVSTAERLAMEIGSMAGFDVPGANPAAHKARALCVELATINEDLAAEGFTMLRAGATYDEIKARFKALIDAAVPLRENAA